jgi:hypothetical protein
MSIRRPVARAFRLAAAFVVTSTAPGSGRDHRTCSAGPGSQTSLFVRGGESDYVRVLVDGVSANDAGGRDRPRLARPAVP